MNRIFLKFYLDTKQLYFDSFFGHNQAKNKIEMIEKYNIINTFFLSFLFYFQPDDDQTMSRNTAIQYLNKILKMYSNKTFFNEQNS